MEQEKRRLYAEMPIAVHSYDVDYMQVVNNTVYVKWFEDLRMAMLDKYFPLKRMLEDGNTPIISETTVKYHRPVTFDSNPVGRVWIAEMGKSKWVARFEIAEGDALYCEGMQVGYYYNMASKRPTRFPEEFVDKFNE